MTPGLRRSAAKARAHALLTGRFEWHDVKDDSVEVEWLGWRDRWSIAGIHSYDWWWVRRFGKLSCGCTRNPLTRRMVLIGLRCPEHGPDWAWDDDNETDDSDTVYLDDEPPWDARPDQTWVPPPWQYHRKEGW